LIKKDNKFFYMVHLKVDTPVLLLLVFFKTLLFFCVVSGPQSWHISKRQSPGFRQRRKRGAPGATIEKLSDFFLDKSNA